MDMLTWPSMVLLALLGALLGWALWRVQQLQREIARRDETIDRQAARLAEHDELRGRLERQRHELLANVSHDLRTPLASMQGYIELLLLRHGTLDAAEERAYLQTAARQGERLTRLVADLFDLTRLEAGEWPLAPEDFPAAELAHDLIQQFGPQARQRGLQLEARCDAAGEGANDGALRVHADLGLVARVLTGLLDNALRHTPAGGRIVLEIGRAGAAARVAVQDTGSGIAADALPGLFERYERAARVGAGSSSEHAGLGLAIAQRIVALHGSRLEVASRVGAGTCVSFVLPLAATSARRVPA